MKDLMKQARSFITFDFPLQTVHISAQFAKTHSKLQIETPEWSTTATRQQLISKYWSTYVAGHFAILFGLPVLILFLLHGGFDQPRFYLVTVFIAGLLSYSVLYLVHYRPFFSSVYLPRLETVKEAYEHKHSEQLEKCRQAQLSNFSLALFFYVLTHTNSLNPLSCDDHSANLLIKLYGVDQGSMKKNLELILGTDKRKNMSDRKITELRNRFAETYDYLEALGFSAGIERLKELEAKFF
ncbi:MAG: hypothetical protein Q8K66_07430 [Sediminibacterium sp.]|nr:hypothetical protein [Sediminibacterium sp.]MDP3127957.1 hypothetical protein [Sediminibacterium sp.]